MVLIGCIEILSQLLLDGPTQLEASPQRNVTVIGDGAVIELAKPLDEPIGLLLICRVFELLLQDFLAAGVLRAAFQVGNERTQGVVGR